MTPAQQEVIDRIKASGTKCHMATSVEELIRMNHAGIGCGLDVSKLTQKEQEELLCILNQ